jgi:hypothetical protein
MHLYTGVTYVEDMEQVKFISKVSTMGQDRYLVFFPKDFAKYGKRLKGKHVRVILEEMSP